MAEKYAWEHKNDPTWPYWEIEYAPLWVNIWRHHKFCPIGERYAIRGINYRTVPVTEEYYRLFAITDYNKEAEN